MPATAGLDTAELMKTFSSLFLGSGKTKTQEDTTSSAGMLMSNQALLNAVMPAAMGDTSGTDAVVNNIMQKAAIAFAPVVGQQNSSGLYRTTVLKQLASEAQARATGEASAAVLQHQTSAQQIAASAIGKGLDATKTVTGSRVTAPQVSPSVSQMLGLGIAGLSAYNNSDKLMKLFGFSSRASRDQALFDRGITGRTKPDPYGEEEAAAANPAYSGDTAIAGADSPAGATGTVGASLETGGFTTGVSSAGGEGGGALLDASSFTGGDFASTAAAFGSVSAATLGSEAADEAGLVFDSFDATSNLSDTGTSLGTDFAGDLSGEFGASSAAGEAAGDLGGGGVGLAGAAAKGITGLLTDDETANQAVGAAVDATSLAFGNPIPAVLDIVDAAWIICTELVRQKRMPIRYWAAGTRKFASYWEYGKRGYYIWAIPSVRHLRKKPNSYYSRFLCYIFNARAEHIAACAGVRGANKNFLGACISHSLWAVCALLAVTVCQFVTVPDYTVVYDTTRVGKRSW